MESVNYEHHKTLNFWRRWKRTFENKRKVPWRNKFVFLWRNSCCKNRHNKNLIKITTLSIMCKRLGVKKCREETFHLIPLEITDSLFHPIQKYLLFQKKLIIFSSLTSSIPKKRHQMFFSVQYKDKTKFYTESNSFSERNAAPTPPHNIKSAKKGKIKRKSSVFVRTLYEWFFSHNDVTLSFFNVQFLCKTNFQTTIFLRTFFIFCLLDVNTKNDLFLWKIRLLNEILIRILISTLLNEFTNTSQL